MATEEAPRYIDVLTFSNDLSQKPQELDGFIDMEKRRIGYGPATNEIAVSHLLMRTGKEFLEGITSDALHSGKPKNFYPGGIRFEKASMGFTEASDNEKKMIMTNYAAVVYGLAISMIDQMVTSKTGIFPVGEFATRYGLLIAQTGYPALELTHFNDPNAKDVHLSITDEGPSEIIPPQDMEQLIKAYEHGGILYLFDNNQTYSSLPKSLLWFFKKQGLNTYMPTVHAEARKLVRVLEKGRRIVSKSIADNLIENDFPWNEKFRKAKEKQKADEYQAMLDSLLKPFEN